MHIIIVTQYESAWTCKSNQSKGKEKNMTEKEEKILYTASYGGEEPEKASFPFVMALAALSMDVKATIVLMGNGVLLAQKGYIDDLPPGGGFPPLKKLMADFMELGGELKVCVPCIRGRNIEESDLIEGAETIMAGAVTVKVLESDAVMTF
jgi:predicted peroxiredoxin